ncbi:hypothetical protein Pint_17509 [Pistacia integerrima]|uniref:Uncharacterized protein n=1 Tax=Pistacia integerrima TaxID=434235 RepID=A0ACC0Z0V2_9ROSI|nr:hypothetical protein Pint_17509 [Pistacia integerrima]
MADALSRGQEVADNDAVLAKSEGDLINLTVHQETMAAMLAVSTLTVLVFALLQQLREALMQDVSGAFKSRAANQVIGRMPLLSLGWSRQDLEDYQSRSVEFILA